MGCFDTVRVPCPACGRRRDFQSKSGSCNLATYLLERAPDDVLMDVNRHGPQTCECGVTFDVALKVIATPRRVECTADCSLQDGHADDCPWRR